MLRAIYSVVDGVSRVCWFAVAWVFIYVGGEMLHNPTHLGVAAATVESREGNITLPDGNGIRNPFEPAVHAAGPR